MSRASRQRPISNEGESSPDSIASPIPGEARKTLQESAWSSNTRGVRRGAGPVSKTVPRGIVTFHSRLQYSLQGEPCEAPEAAVP